MTKIEIVQNLCDELDLTKNDSSRIVESVLDLIKENLSHGENVKISGFGVFGVKEKKSRRGRNPQTGDQMEICRRKVLTFKASQVLRKILNK